MADLDRLASTDPLTGIYNRRFFLQRMEEEMSRASRNLSPISLIYLDIDFFKVINDTHGHQAGDAVLKQIARIMVRMLRKSDILGRIGGEEFMILLPDTDGMAGRVIAERLRKRVENTPFLIKEEPIDVTVEGDGFREQLAPLSKQEISLYLQRVGVTLVVGQRAEIHWVSPRLDRSFHDVGGVLGFRVGLGLRLRLRFLSRVGFLLLRRLGLAGGPGFRFGRTIGSENRHAERRRQDGKEQAVLGHGKSPAKTRRDNRRAVGQSRPSGSVFLAPSR